MFVGDGAVVVIVVVLWMSCLLLLLWLFLLFWFSVVVVALVSVRFLMNVAAEFCSSASVWFTKKSITGDSSPGPGSY